ncbi:MAG: hypothetical protein ACOCXG_02225 [Nanoarchaeota archaeon]
MTDIKIIKSCTEKDYENKKSPEEPLSNYLYSLTYIKKINKLKEDEEFINSLIDDLFTAIQLISNAILLKKIGIRAKKSNCCYYRLFQEKIINNETYQKIDNLRELRNKAHYDGYQTMLNDPEEQKEIIEENLKIYKKLEEVFES